MRPFYQTLKSWKFILIAAPLIMAIIYLAYQSLPQNPKRLRQPGDPPNVVMILVDTLRSDHLSLNGYDRNTSPNLDALAQESIVFSNIIANSSWTLPNMTTMFSGLHPQQHKIEKKEVQNTERFTFLPEILKTYGYYTYGYSTNWHIAPRNNFNQGFDEFYEKVNRRNDLDYGDIAEVMDTAQEWLRDQKSEPFFMYLHTMNTHAPYKLPVGEKVYADETDGAFEPWGTVMRGVLQVDPQQYRPQVTDEYQRDLINTYDSTVVYTDKQLGLFIEELKKLGLYDNTMIIVTADHGEELYDHGGFSHGFTAYQEILRTTLLIKPATNMDSSVLSQTGNYYTEPGQQIDFLPTLLSLLNIPIPNRAKGQNLLWRQGYQPQGIITRGRWRERLMANTFIDWPYKLIKIKQSYDKTNAVELYNLDADPQEKNNLADQIPEKIQELETKFKLVYKHISKTKRQLKK